MGVYFLDPIYPSNFDVPFQVPIFPAIHQTSFSDDLMFVNIEDIPHKMRHNNNSASDEDDDDDNVTLYNGSWDYKSVPTVPLSPSTASTTNVLHAKSNSVSGAITSAKPSEYSLHQLGQCTFSSAAPWKSENKIVEISIL